MIRRTWRLTNLLMHAQDRLYCVLHKDPSKFAAVQLRRCVVVLLEAPMPAEAPAHPPSRGFGVAGNKPSRTFCETCSGFIGVEKISSICAARNDKEAAQAGCLFCNLT